jgi:hypothetical protein
MTQSPLRSFLLALMNNNFPPKFLSLMQVKDDLLAVLSSTRERYAHQRSKEIQRLLQNIGLDEQTFSIKPNASLNTSEPKVRNEIQSSLCYLQGPELSMDGFTHTVRKGIGQNIASSNQLF